MFNFWIRKYETRLLRPLCNWKTMQSEVWHTVYRVEAQLIILTLIFGLPLMFHVRVVPWLRRLNHHIIVRHVKLPNNMKTWCKSIFNIKERIPRVEDARHQTTLVAKRIDRENVLTWMKLSFLLWSICFDLVGLRRA